MRLPLFDSGRALAAGDEAARNGPHVGYTLALVESCGIMLARTVLLPSPAAREHDPSAGSAN
jgi:hypothetical protein